MTALATALALLPLVILGSRPGQEIENPMAIVILGGLATSTVMNLFVLPVLYLRFGRPGVGGPPIGIRRAKDRPREPQAADEARPRVTVLREHPAGA